MTCAPGKGNFQLCHDKICCILREGLCSLALSRAVCLAGAQIAHWVAGSLQTGMYGKRICCSCLAGVCARRAVKSYRGQRSDRRCAGVWCSVLTCLCQADSQVVSMMNSIIGCSFWCFRCHGMYAAAEASSTACWQVVASIVSAALMDRAGRRPLLLCSHAGMGTCLAVLSLAFVLPCTPAPTSPPPALCVSFSLPACCLLRVLLSPLEAVCSCIRLL